MKPSTITREPALCKLGQSNIKKRAFIFFLQSCGIIREYTVLSLQITPLPNLPAPKALHVRSLTHMLSQLPYLPLLASSLKQ